MGWSKQQAKLFAKRVQKHWGNGWGLLGKELQVAALAHEFTNVVTFQSLPTLATIDIAQLWRDMLLETGLFDEEE